MGGREVKVVLRVYLAAPYPILATARTVMEQLKRDGIGCTSRWLTEDSAELNDEWARKDLSDVAAADALVALNPVEWSQKGTGGRHVELGFAIALHKPIVVVGVRSNIFHYLSNVTVVDFGRNGFDLLSMSIREVVLRAGGNR